MDGIRGNILIEDKNGNIILTGYTFPRNVAPATLTTKQRNLIEPYLYPNPKPIIVDSKSTVLNMLVGYAALFITTDDVGLLLEAVRFLEQDDFDLIVTKASQEFINNPNRYLEVENPQIYVEVAKFFDKTTSPSESLEQSEDEQGSVKYYDCGDSESCFLEYVKTCSPAKVEISNLIVITEEKIEGFKNDKCIITTKFLYSAIEDMIGEEMSCEIPKSNLVDYRGYLEEEGVTEQSCDGSFIDSLKEQVSN